MAFTAKDVVALRERTGVGMMDCKKALTEADGDMDKAIDILREKGLAKQAKKASRVAAEGVAYATVDADKKVGVLVEVNSETDFAAKSDKFMDFVKTVAQTIIDGNPADVDALMAMTCPTGATLADELRDKVIGVVGGGNIGRMVLQRLQGWECKDFLYYDPYPMPKELEEKLHCRRVDLETLLRESDVVSLHCPLTKDTRGLIGEEQFNMMKPNAIIVNEARGAVIDDKALVKALEEGKIWGAAIDTWEKEPLDPNDPLVKMEKVITTSHLGAATRETVVRCFGVGYDNIMRMRRGEELRNRIV